MSEKIDVKQLRELQRNSTQVVAWYPHEEDGTVRGPFCRWLTVSDVTEAYRKHVADKGADASFAAAAMNNLVPLLDAIDSLRAELEQVKLERDELKAAIEGPNGMNSLRHRVTMYLKIIEEKEKELAAEKARADKEYERALEDAAKICAQNADSFKSDPGCVTCGHISFSAKTLDSYQMGCRDAHRGDALQIRAPREKKEGKT